MLFFGICLITLGSVVHDLKEKYRLDDISSGTLFSILPFGILGGSLLFGPFCDKYGYKILLALSCFLMFAGFEGIAYAPSHLLLKVYIFLFGLGGGSVNGATNALVSDISEKDKGADLSLLGVFYGLGALGMPFIVALLASRFSYEGIVSIVGFATLVLGIFYLLIKFPLPKQSRGVPIKDIITLVKDGVLILIAFFLFCQSSFEAIINNWTTTYLTNYVLIEPGKSLYALVQILLRGESPLTEAERELISAYVSFRNECMFCMSSHAAAARCLYGNDAGIVDEVLKDMQQSGVSEKMKSLLYIAGKVQILGKEVKPEDIEAARSLGANDREIHDTVLIAATFSMFNRYVDGLASFTPTDPEEYKAMGERMAKGYTMPQQPAE